MVLEADVPPETPLILFVSFCNFFVAWVCTYIAQYGDWLATACHIQCLLLYHIVIYFKLEYKHGLVYLFTNIHATIYQLNLL